MKTLGHYPFNQVQCSYNEDLEQVLQLPRNNNFSGPFNLHTKYSYQEVSSSVQEPLGGGF